MKVHFFSSLFTYLLAEDVCLSTASSSSTATWLRHSSTCLLSSDSFPPTHRKLRPHTGQCGGRASTSLADTPSLLVTAWDGVDCGQANSMEGKFGSACARISAETVADFVLLSEEWRCNMDTTVSESSGRSCDILTPARACDKISFTRNKFHFFFSHQ